MASCMIFLGAILLPIGIIMSLFSFAVGAIVGGSPSGDLLLIGITMSVFSYLVLRAGLSARDRHNKC